MPRKSPDPITVPLQLSLTRGARSDGTRCLRLEVVDACSSQVIITAMISGAEAVADFLSQCRADVPGAGEINMGAAPIWGNTLALKHVLVPLGDNEWGNGAAAKAVDWAEAHHPGWKAETSSLKWNSHLVRNKPPVSGGTSQVVPIRAYEVTLIRYLRPGETEDESCD